MFTEKYGELCRGVDCTNLKSCAECNIGKKLNLCAVYEDIGLTPEEIMKLNNFSESQLAKLLEENCRLKQESDFWKREAIKAQAGLGEKLIESVKLDDITTNMAEHICDNICKYPEAYQECDNDSLEEICAECKIGKYICNLLNLSKGGIADGKDK